VQVVDQIEVATLGDVDDTLEHASGVLRSVRVEDAPAATLAKDAAALTLGAAAPDAVVHVVLERVLEALARDGTGGADSLRNDHADAISRKESPGGVLAALPVCHPFGTHAHPRQPVISLTVATLCVTN
jgi:hypothetical protein